MDLRIHATHAVLSGAPLRIPLDWIQRVRAVRVKEMTSKLTNGALPWSLKKQFSNLKAIKLLENR